jgi:hypothetical protein
MTNRQLLNRLACAMIDWQADMLSDIIAHYHRNATLDRLRRQLLVSMTMHRMVRAMLDAHTERGSLDTRWRECSPRSTPIRAPSSRTLNEPSKKPKARPPASSRGL